MVKNATLRQVSVVMAVYRPDMERLKKQVQSIREQADVTPKLHLFTDGPFEQAEAIETLCKTWGDVNFEAFATNRGPAATFLAGLERAFKKDGDQSFYAFADQDDIWLTSKLARSVQKLEAESALAVHTDAGLVDWSGATIDQSMFRFERRDRNPSLKRLFFRNNATGMTMVMQARLVEQMLALRQMRPTGWLHDHFAAFLAEAGGGLAFLDEPTVQYVQHGGNVVGAQSAKKGIGASGNFLAAGGKTDRMLMEGCRLVDGVLEQGQSSLTGQGDLRDLQRLLEGRGVFDCLVSLSELLQLTARSRQLLARLVWCKLISHRWPVEDQAL